METRYSFAFPRSRRIRAAARAWALRGGIVAAVTLGLLAAAGCGRAAGKPAGAQSASAVALPMVETQATTHTSTQPPYTASISLPQITWPGHTAVAAGVNAAVQAWAKSQQTAFAAGVTTDLAKAHNLSASLPESHLTITYSVSLVNPRYASYDFEVEPSYRGAASPAQIPTGLTFDLASGKQLTLPGLFKTGTDYLSVLAAQAGTGLAKFSPAGAHCYLGRHPSAKAANFSAWWLSPTGLVLSFPGGMYTAVYCGPPTITVPFSALRAMAAPGSPLLGVA